MIKSFFSDPMCLIGALVPVCLIAYAVVTLISILA